jgi:tetratricopeptide (TPR) repeat protein
LRLLGQVHLLIGSLSAARAEFEQACRLIDGVARENPKVIEIRYSQGEIYYYLGQVLAEGGRTVEARVLLQKDIAMERQQLPLNPTFSETAMNLAEADSFLAGVERETDHFDLAEGACEEALRLTNRERLGPTPNATSQAIHFHNVVESVRLAARTGKSLASRENTLRTLLEAMEEKTPGRPLSGVLGRLAVEGHLALAEVAVRSGRAPEILSALKSADCRLEVLIRTTPGRPRLTNLKATIEMMRGCALRRAGEAGEAAAAAKLAVDIEKTLASKDPSYSFDFACALALQARLDPTAPGAAAAAVEALGKAVAAGFDNVDKLKRDERLESIRSRDDFLRVIRHLAKTSVTPGDTGHDQNR